MIAQAMENETLDALVWRVLGEGSGMVEKVMEINPQFAGLVILPNGANVTLPDFNNLETPTRQIINLWD